MEKQSMSFTDLIDNVEKQIIRLNYCKKYVRQYRECWNVLRKYMVQINEPIFTPDIATKFLLERYNIEMFTHIKMTSYKSLMRRAVLMLLEYQVTGKIIKKIAFKEHAYPVDFKPICIDYIHYLRNDRCLSEGNIRGYIRCLESFTKYLVSRQIFDIKNVDAKILFDYINIFSGCSKAYVNLNIQKLKSFFTYLYTKELYPIDIKKSFPNVHVEKYCNIPETFSEDEEKRILSVIDRSNPLGKRDYAIILLAVRYGLRVGDIKNLELSNIDFKNCKLQLTQSKTKKYIEFELFDDVAWALIDYLKNGRPTQSVDKKIFVLHKAPYSAFSANNCLGQLVYRYGFKAGVTVTRKRCSMHMFRYTLASSMLLNGTPLPVVSNILGHSQLDTTKIYTKIDYSQLSLCALEVPHEN